MSTFSTRKPPKNGLFLASRRPPPPGPPQDLCSGPLGPLKTPKNTLKSIPDLISIYLYLMSSHSFLYVLDPNTSCPHLMWYAGPPVRPWGERGLLGRDPRNEKPYI